MASDTTADPSSEQAMLGSLINGYRVVRLIGRGGMGSVFEAELAIRNSASGAARKVAVKVLHSRLAATDPTAVDRFINEARSTSRVSHPGLVRVLDFGYLESGAVYIMMELLNGELLRERLRKRSPLPLDEACRLGHQIAEALSASHDTGIVHRDLKPENLMILPADRTGKPDGERIKVLDFGLAKIVAAAAQETLPGYKTATGAILGTPTYMSPEKNPPEAERPSMGPQA